MQTLGPTAVVAVDDAVAAEWTNTFTVPVKVRIVADVNCNFRVTPSAAPVAADPSDSPYLPMDLPECVNIGVGETISVIGHAADDTGFFYITEYRNG